MPRGRYQESLTDQEAIKRELEDHEMIKPEDWLCNQELNFILDKIGGEKVFEKSCFKEFFESEDSIERLKILKKANLLTQISCLQNSGNSNVVEYIEQRLEFYRDLIRDQAFRKNEYTGEEERIDSKYVKPQDLATGLQRDILYGSMIGTPELAIYKIAEKRVKKLGFDWSHFPAVRGKDSGITWRSGDIGGTYPLLRKIYEQAEKVERGKLKGEDIGGEILEHKAILTASGWLVESTQYNDPRRSPESPYVSKADEAVAWARLGPVVKKQLRGMRRKIMKIDLKNIGRFIGKSGDSKYTRERNSLKWKIENFDDYISNNPEVLGEVTPEVFLEQLKERKSVVDEKYAKTISLAEKAIHLFFADEKEHSPVDWINKAPLGLIKWAYNGLQRKVNPDVIFGYANASYIFPNETVNRDLIKLASGLDKYKAERIEKIRKLNNKFKIAASPNELILLVDLFNASNFEEAYGGLLKIGYTKDEILEYPWLAKVGTERLKKDKFPVVSSRGIKSKQQAWCVRNAFYVPEAWNGKRLGGIILNRLNGQIDQNIHDATYWLKEFEVPDEKSGIVYRDHEAEMQLLYSLTDVPKKLLNRIPRERNKYSELFSRDATQLIYEAILPLVTGGSIDLEEIRENVRKKIDLYKQRPKMARSLKVPLLDLEVEIEGKLDELRELFKSRPATKYYPEWVAQLRKVGKVRKEFIDTAQTWLQQHSSAPHDILTVAWANREDALADGCKDNPRAIKQWADLNSLRVAFERMCKDDNLPFGFEKDDINKYSAWLNELVRCYSGEIAIKTVAQLKENFNPDFYIPPMRIDFGDGWVGEVLAKSDPRGFTIGYDTGCCMTLGGASESCIAAGYKEPNYGFFALYRNGQMVAQSFLYLNKEKAPDTIVCDNIEANAGRDLHKVRERYKSFFDRYTKTGLRRWPDFNVSKVNIGEGYSDVGLTDLPKTKAVSTPDSSIYTDAKKQRRLLELESKEAVRLKNIKTEIASKFNWSGIREQILGIEEYAFEGKGYTESQLKSEFEHPDSIVVLLKDSDKIIGYCTAIPKDNEILYISSTAILPKYQGRGLVSDIMHKLDIEAKKDNYKYYSRHANVTNGYADKLKRNYTVLEEGEVFNTPLGQAQYLKMVVPEHPKSKAMEEAEGIEHEKREYNFVFLESDQSAIVSELESAIYPSALRQGRDFFEDELYFEPGERHKNASFLLTENHGGREIPIGYVVAYVANESEVYEDEKAVLYISDMALLPGYQGKGQGRRMLGRLIKFAKGRQGMPIEFHARLATSYSALMHSKDEVKEMGYKIDYDELLKDYFVDESTGEGEDVHLVRLKCIEEMKVKKAA